MSHSFGRVLVTGGAGFIGSQLLLRLLPVSEHITVIDDCSTSRRENVPVSDRITFHETSYVNDELLERVLPGTTHIFHLACRNLVMSAENMDDDYHVNLYGGYLLLQKVKRLCPDLQRFVYTSTASVYGNAELYPTPESWHQTTVPYAASKFSMEHYCQVYFKMHQLPVSVLRLSNVYGPGQLTTNPYCGVVAKFFEEAELGKPFTIFGDGTNTRDYTYIDDAIDALMAAGIHSEAIGKVFNVGTGIETSVARLADHISEIAEQSELAFAWHPKRKVDIVHRRSLDSSLLQKTLGWKPNVDLASGLRKTDQWRRGGELLK